MGLDPSLFYLISEITESQKSTVQTATGNSSSTIVGLIVSSSFSTLKLPTICCWRLGVLAHVIFQQTLNVGIFQDNRIKTDVLADK